MSLFKAMIGIAFAEMEEMKAKNTQKLASIIEQWVESKHFPRKKKKLVRKHLQLEYSIFKWAEESFFTL